MRGKGGGNEGKEGGNEGNGGRELRQDGGIEGEGDEGWNCIWSITTLQALCAGADARWHSASPGRCAPTANHCHTAGITVLLYV